MRRGCSALARKGGERELAELWNIVDRRGRPTGRTVVRGQPIAPGDYHVVVNVWIKDQAERWLIQRRAEHVESSPALWAATAGAVLAGEDALTAALRETREELGLSFASSELKPVLKKVWSDSIAVVHLVCVDSGRIRHVVRGPEVAEVKWASGAEIDAMVARGEFFDYGSQYFGAVGVGSSAR